MPAQQSEYSIKFTADGRQAADVTRNVVDDLKATEKVTDRINQVQKAQARWLKELADIRRRQRQDAFNELSVEERLTRLKERQAKVQERMARSQNNATRSAALRLRDAQLGVQIGSIQAGINRGIADQERGVSTKILEGLGLSRLVPFAGKVSLGGLAQLGGAAALFAGVSGQARAANDRVTRSQRASIAERDIQALGFASSATDVDRNLVERSIIELRKRQGDALIQGPNSDAAKNFKQLGISTQRLQSANTLELFTQILQRFSDGKESAREFAAAMQVLGEQFRDVLPAVKSGLGERIESFKTGRLAIDPGTTKTLAELFSTVKGGLALGGATAKKGAAELFGGLVNVGKLGLGTAAGLAAPFSSRAAAFQEQLFVTRIQRGRLADSGVDADIAAKLAQRQEARQRRNEDKLKRVEEAKALGRQNRAAVSAQRFEALPAGEQIERLLAFRRSLRESIRGAGDPLRREQLISADIRAGNDLRGLQSLQGVGGVPGGSRDTDALRRIGFFVGPAAQAVKQLDFDRKALDEEKKQTSELEKLNAHMEEFKEEL